MKCMRTYHPVGIMSSRCGPNPSVDFPLKVRRFTLRNQIHYENEIKRNVRAPFGAIFILIPRHNEVAAGVCFRH